MEDEEGQEGFMSTSDEETFWVLEENDAFVARKVSGRNFRFKKRKGKGKSTSKKGSHQRGGFKPVALAGRPIWPVKIRMPTTRHIGEKAGKERKIEIPISYDGNKGYPSYDNGKGKGGQEKGTSKMFAAIAEKTEEQPAIQPTAPSTEPTYAGWTDQDWDPSWNWSEQGWYSSHESSSTAQAMMAFHDAYEQHEKDAIHEKLIQANAVSEQSITATAKQSLLATKLMAPVISPHN